MKQILPILATLLAGTFNMNAKQLLVFVGAYASGPEQGISVYRMCSSSGSLTKISVLGGQKNPSFLEVHPNGKYLYAVNEIGTFEGKKQGAVSAYAIDAQKGELTFLNQQGSGGGSPCHLSIDEAGRNVLVANYSGGSVTCLQIGKEGRLSPATDFIQHEGSSINKSRQSAPHGHSINFDPANKFAFAADLGLDKVLVYKVDSEKGKMKPHGHAEVAPVLDLVTLPFVQMASSHMSSMNFSPMLQLSNMTAKAVYPRFKPSQPCQQATPKGIPPPKSVFIPMASFFTVPTAVTIVLLSSKFMNNLALSLL